jgi:RNA polymerase sigma factor (sigma-70 family)
VALRQEEFTRLCDDVDLDRDRILVERCQAGDAGAFGSLYARYYERLLRFCLRRLHDRHEAEDAAQEAFARAWKALPNFAGERRFYPWLTVIAGNICTDMLRRRSRSTPTEDVELGARPPVGATTAATADEMIIAAADGELAHKALDRLSVRHRHVLALREDSGWTYQQIADHEGVEIGTIETLLWRARQALKREFIALSESKGPFAGFLLAVGAGIRTVVVRSAHRVAALQPGLGSGSFRNALAGFAVTSAAITAAFIAPHALDSSHQAPVQLPAPAATGVGASRASASITPSAGSAAGGSTTASGAHLDGRGSTSSSACSGSGSGSGSGLGLGSVGGLDPNLGSSGTGLLSGGAASTAPVTELSAPAQSLLPLQSLLPQELLGSVASGASGALSQTVAGATASPVTGVVPTTVGAIGTTVAGLGSALGSGAASLPLGSSSSSSSSSSTSTASAVQSAAPTSTTTTTPASGLAGITSTALSALHALGQG